MPRITVDAPGGFSLSIRLEQPAIAIGRAVQNDVTVDDPKVSRFHAEIVKRGRSWRLIDKSSANGTWRGSRRVTGEVTLAEGDAIRIGRHILRFSLAESGAGEDLGTERAAPRPVPPATPAPTAMLPELVGSSPAVRALDRTITKLSQVSSSVLLTGETGTGKELVARLIHARSPRSARPFEVVNCPSLHGELVETELFGSAMRDGDSVRVRHGRLEQADGGTLLLDEVGDLEPRAQARLLRFLETRSFERVGGSRLVRLDVRVLAATNRDLEDAVAAGHFRRDLYYRLSVIGLVLPPLRARREDIPLLVEHSLSRRAGTRRRVGHDALAVLMAHSFPGNVRELQHLLESACVFSDREELGSQDFPAALRTHGGAGAPADEATGNRAADLYRRITSGGESFWTVVRDAYLRRDLGRQEARALVLHAYQEAGKSYKRAATALGVEHRPLLAFLANHRLRARD